MRLFDVIQTVDSVELAEKIARAAESAGKRQDVLLQVNIGGSRRRAGAAPDERAGTGAAGSPPCRALHLTGLMAIPPAGDAGGDAALLSRAAGDAR